MTDVWWGIVEQNPQQYNWTAYLQLANMVRVVDFFLLYFESTLLIDQVKQVGLHMQVVMSFRIHLI